MNNQIDTLLDSLGSADATRFYGKYRGLVVNNVDPLNMGRLQATVPEVLGESISTWASPCVPYAGTGAGQFTVPMIGSGVWIEFEAGDPSRPIWSGCWWGSGEVPSDEKGTQAQFNTKILRTDFGLLIAMDDIGQTITLADGNGLNLMTIKVLEGTIQIKSLVKVELEAPLIFHGQNANHPAVFGDQLLAYLTQLVTTFNTHMHPGEMAAGFIPVTPAPPVAPMQPPTPALLSVKNLVE